jgi:hypothetical protein
MPVTWSPRTSCLTVWGSRAFWSMCFLWHFPATRRNHGLLGGKLKHAKWHNQPMFPAGGKYVIRALDFGLSPLWMRRASFSCDVTQCNPIQVQIHFVGTICLRNFRWLASDYSALRAHWRSDDTLASYPVGFLFHSRSDTNYPERFHSFFAAPSRKFWDITSRVSSQILFNFSFISYSTNRGYWQQHRQCPVYNPPSPHLHGFTSQGILLFMNGVWGE